MIDQGGTFQDQPVRRVVPVPGWDGGNADAAYLDKTLRYGEIETELDESVSGRALFQIWWRATVASCTVFAFFFFIIVIIAVSSANASAIVEPSVGILGVGVILLPFVVFWVVLLAARVPEPIAEWRVLLTDRAGSATSTYSQVTGSLRARRMPIHHEVKPVDTGSRRDGVRYRLVLRENFYVAYISVFAYGTSLYLGWMMWRSRRGYELFLQFFTDLIGGMLGRTDPELLMLRTERPRAMREAVHSACREGLFVAYEQRHVPLDFGFPNAQERSLIPGAPAATASPFQPQPQPHSEGRPTQPFDPGSAGFPFQQQQQQQPYPTPPFDPGSGSPFQQQPYSAPPFDPGTAGSPFQQQQQQQQPQLTPRPAQQYDPGSVAPTYEASQYPPLSRPPAPPPFPPPPEQGRGPYTPPTPPGEHEWPNQGPPAWPPADPVGPGDDYYPTGR